MATRIGCDNLVYAIMTTEETATTNAVYDVPTAAPGVMSITVNPNASQETLFADDGPMETATTLGKIEVEIQKNELTTQNKADLLGHAIDADGALVFGDSDVPPFVAIGFRSLKSNGEYRYVWLYKGKFTDPEDKLETKGDGISFQSDTFKGQFVKLSKPVTVNGRSIRPWKYELDGDHAGANEAAMASWFTAVAMPSTSATALAPLLTVAIAKGTAVGSTKATITGAAGAGNRFAYMLSTVTVPQPSVGDPMLLPLTTYASAADITGAAAGQILTILEVTAANTAVKYYTHVLEAADIL
jgi:phi13 family phage major tail protein